MVGIEFHWSMVLQKMQAYRFQLFCNGKKNIDRKSAYFNVPWNDGGVINELQAFLPALLHKHPDSR